MASQKSGPLGLLFRPFAWAWRRIAGFGRWYRNLYRGASIGRKIMLVLVSSVVYLLTYCVAVQLNLFWLFGRSPSLNSIMHPKTAAASELYTADGKLLGKVFSENRTPVPYDSIAPAFIDALISTEDERFYSHAGVDFYGIFAAVKDAALGRPRGASTITQQLVKNMFRVRTEYSTGLLGYIPGVKMLVMKSKEMIIATELEWFYSKAEILPLYANTVDFGSNAYGIKTAAKTYFKTTPSALKTEEAAVLVGLLKATTAYNPKVNPKRSLERRNVVLDNMVRNGKLSQPEASRLKELPLELKFGSETLFDGLAHYFRNAVAEEIKSVAPELDPYRDGLKIYTTLDSRMQRYAEAAVREQMRQVQRNFNAHWGSQDPWVDEKNRPIRDFLDKKIKTTDAYKQLTARYPDNPQRVMQLLNQPHKVKLFTYDGVVEREMSSIDSLRYMLHFMHTGFVAVEPSTGDVKAYVGDIDFNTWQYDNVRGAHQPGSTFKLFVYATAIKQGWLPTDARLADSYVQMEVYDPVKKEKTLWRPSNANGRYSGAKLPLRTAFAQSVNTIAVKLGQEVGIDNVVRTAKEMGVNSPLQATPALALGASDATVLEMAGAYAAVANYGEFVRPRMVSKIYDSDGRLVYEAHREVKTVMTQQEAFHMQTLLSAGVNDAGGTSQSLRAQEYCGTWLANGQLNLGGKTGTSNAHADAWFVGVTPNLVAAAWVGGEYRQIHFRTGSLGQGAKTALPIFGLFMNKVLSDPKLRDRYLAHYKVPEGMNADDLLHISVPSDTDSVQVDTLSYHDLWEDEGDHELPDLEPVDPQPAAPTPPPAPTTPTAPAPKVKPQTPNPNPPDIFN